jgi:hypothetical protein
MITLVEVEKLGRVHAVEPIVLSVYLNVPRSARLGWLPVIRARETTDRLVQIF